MRQKLFVLYTSYLSPLFYGLLLSNKLFERDFHRTFVIKLLNGCDRKDLYKEAESFFGNHLTNRKIFRVHNLLEKAILDKSCDVRIASSSIDPVVSAVAKALEIPYVCSQLEYCDNISNGKLLYDITGVKHKKIDFGKNEFYSDITVVSDNLSDIKLLKMATNPIIVLNKSKDKLKWRFIRATFMKVWED